MSDRVNEGAGPPDDFDRAACGLATLAPGGRFTRVNTTLCRWIGYSAGELESRRFQDVLSIGSKLFHQTHWLPLLQLQGSVCEVQLELTKRDGSVVPVLVNAVQRNRADPKAGTDLAIFVTADRRKYERELLLARRRAEELLEEARVAQEARTEAEVMLRLALDSAGLFVWSVDLSTGQRRYEPGVAALIGLEPGSEPSSELYTGCIEPADRAAEAEAFAAAIDPARRAKYAVEYRLDGRDGVERVVRSTGRAFFDDQGRATRFSGVIEEVTKRRRAEALLRLREYEFRMVAENSPDVIARFDRELRCVYLSPAAGTLLSDPLDALLGQSAASIPLLAPLAGGIEEALQGAERTCVFSFQGKGGRLHELEARVVPERDARGQVVSALAMTRDVTLLRQHERDAEQRAVLAEQLIGIVSHDLRNPLHAVVIGTDLLSTMDLGAGQRAVSRIASAAQRANRLVSDLLDFTRARLGGGLRAEVQPIDLHALVAETVDELRLAWPGRSIVHELTGSGSGSADPDRISQIISNLVSNALVYGSPDRPVVVHSVVALEALELQVHNDGPPIPEPMQAQIFEPLHRGTHVGAAHRSIGLGLYIVREIATAHGGTVEVRSAPAEGTTFVVRLPQRAALPA